MKALKHKILILGDVTMKYRGRVIISALTEDPLDGCFRISQANPGLYRSKNSATYPAPIRALLTCFVHLAFAFESIIKALFVDAVVVMPSQQKSVFVQAFLIKILLRKRMIADQHTFVSTTYLARNNTSSGETLQLKSLKLADRVMLKFPDLITNISYSELRQVSSYLGYDLHGKAIKIIPISVPAKPVATLSHRDAFHMMWWGRINNLHGLPTIVGACKILEQTSLSKDWKLSFFATPDTVNELSVLRKQIWNAGVEAKVTVHVDRNFKNGLEQLICDECDLALGHFSDDSEKAKTIITHKLVDAMAFGVPVLNRSTSAVEELIDVSNEIFVCSPEAESLAEAIKSIIENPEERTRRARNGHSAWKNRFSLEASAVEFGRIIRDFCEQK